uniref:Pentatricopeptide repeat-containing protein n=1 Tax=Kalanchoe fedtschenkoi TaxID=63787 RepID=A0A7N0TJT1_KALFE
MLKLSSPSASTSGRHYLTSIYRSLLTRHLPQSQATAFSTSLSRSRRKPRSSPPVSKSLFNRLRQVHDPKVSILPVLEQWARERPVDCLKLQSLVGTMKRLNRWDHALQICQWMTDRRYYVLTPKDVGDRLELLAKVHGIEHAEKYFDSLKDNLKAEVVYGAMLRNYVQQKAEEKAEDMMMKMRQLGMATDSFSYNNMIHLYSQIGRHDKVDQLVQEMDNKGVPVDIFTRRKLLSAYAASDISKMEGLLNDMKEDPQVNIDWQECSIAADGYIKVGNFGKALEMLKELEGKIPLKGNRFAAENLLTHYADIGSKDDVYRVWNQSKLSNKKLTSFVTCMISCLTKLDDIDGAEEIFNEWQSNCDLYDMRVVNKLLSAYCSKSLVDKAYSFLQEKIVEGKEPYASTWSILMGGYLAQKQMPKAVEMLKKALMTKRQGWRPQSSDLGSCLDYMEGKTDIEGLEEMVLLLKKSGLLTIDMYHRLLRTNIAAGKCVSSVLSQMKADGFSADEETQKILSTSEITQ